MYVCMCADDLTGQGMEYVEAVLNDRYVCM